jgi:hypothetical protein
LRNEALSWRRRSHIGRDSGIEVPNLGKAVYEGACRRRYGIFLQITMKISTVPFNSGTR